MTTNVRFYRVDELPSFDVNKHIGIFVHVTKTMYKDGGSSIEHPNPKEPGKLYMTPEKDGGSIGRINFVQWLEQRRIERIESGLWFGGENGWELLTNETNSGTIDAAINAKIQGLDVDGYAQATITTNTPTEGEPNSTLTISGIKEVDGKIAIDNNNNNKLEVAIDGGYDKTNNKIATQSTVTNEINRLDVGTIQAVTTAPAEGNTANTVLTFKGVKETDGKIAQGDGATTLTVGDAKLKIQIGSSTATATDVFSANAQADSTIKLDGLVFKKNGDVISVITPTPLASNNRLVTEKDVANLAGAMHYKGTISNAAGAWPRTVKAGDVYIATGENFEKEGQVIESGDMIVFNSENPNIFTVVQSNITSGIKSGQIAKNDGNLTPNNMVIATSAGIKTIGITESDLTGTENGNNTRKLTYVNGTPDITGDITLYHSATITDTFKVIGKDFSKSINILSNNRSIEITRNAGEDNSTGVIVDLVWNTSIE